MKWKNLFFFFLGFMPGIAMALGLGKLDLDSGLNQPFEARVELLAVSAEEISTLKVRLADIDAFRRAGIARPFILSQLQFQIVETEVGSDYVRIFSQEPIREPYLNFLVEANWSRGRLFREYTVLLDPPLYDAGVGGVAPKPVSRPEAEPYVPATEPGTQSITPSFTSGITGGEEYGPVGNGETLWSIASRVRPDQSVSVQQMMLALLHANPEAFINNNINGLKRGQILRIPDSGEIQSLGQAEAVREVRTQNSMWEEMRSAIAETTPQRPVSAEAGITAPVIPEEEEAELRLVTAEGEGEGQAGAESEEALDRDLALANEQLETLTQENLELRDRLSEAENVIADLQRLIQLKDDELATLQQQFAQPESEEIIEGPEVGMEEGIIPEEEPEIEQEPVQETVTAEEGVSPPAVVTQPIQAPAGIVDRVRQMVMDNLIIIAGALVGVVVVIVLLVFISRRRGEAAEEGLLPDSGLSETVDEEEVETVFEAGYEEDAAAEVGGVAAEEETEVPEEAGEEPLIPEEEEAEEHTVFAAPSAAEDEAQVEGEQQAEFEEEPLAEVNVFLAYEHFDQAEEFVRNAIEGDPENLDFHLKLLEVFYAAGNKVSYEEEAKILHDLVDGQGSHWDMTAAMWQEMSPNRALFAEPVEGEEAEIAEEAGGMLDLTAAEGQTPEAEKPEAGIDFDIGGEESAEPETDEDVLDISAPSPEEDILDVTAAVSTSDQDQDLLDVTAAVGIEAEPEQEGEEPEETGDDDEILDLTTSDEEPVLDITAGTDDAALDFTSGEASGEDLLDVSKVSGEDLLDVTSHAEYEKGDVEEDLLDVTSSTSAGADSDELLEFDEGESDIGDSEESALDLDISDLSSEAEGKPEIEEDNVIDFDTGSETGSDVDLTLDVESDESLSIEEPAGAGEEGGLDLDLTMGEGESQSDDLELSIDDSDELDTEIDLTVGDESGDTDESLEGAGGLPDLVLDSDEEETGLELELDTGDADQEEQADADMEGTVQMPQIELEPDIEDEDEDEDDDEHTVFVPRSSDTQEQSQEDEISTKLDLAKAYVELGDKESAKGIIEEIMAGGNEDQKRQAQELLKQV